MLEPQNLRVVLVDDQTLVRSGIAGLLALTPDIRVVGEAANYDDARVVVAGLRPDVLLLDVRMPGRSGLDLLATLQEAGTCPPTILLTTFDDDEAMLRGVRAGARGFLLKDISLETLADTIRRVAAGASVIRPVVTERLLQALETVQPVFERLDHPDRLTGRESEVLRLMACGLSNREIADALGMSEGTVKNHISSVLSKLGVRDRVRAVLRGLELGWL